MCSVKSSRKILFRQRNQSSMPPKLSWKVTVRKCIVLLAIICFIYLFWLFWFWFLVKCPLKHVLLQCIVLVILQVQQFFLRGLKKRWSRFGNRAHLLIWFLGGSFMCTPTVANPRIKCVTEPKIFIFLVWKNLNKNYSTWLTHLILEVSLHYWLLWPTVWRTKG